MGLKGQEEAMYIYSPRTGGFLNRFRSYLGCQIPNANSFNPENPWEKISAGERMVSCAQNDLTSGILGENINPYTARHRLFQGIMLSLQGRKEEEMRNQITKANKEANAKTQNLALPAGQIAVA